MPQVSHSIDEEDNSSNEVIAASKETVTAGYAGRVEANTAPLSTNPGQHDLLTVSFDSNLGKPSQMEVPSFLSLSQKSTPFDSLISAPIDAEVMYVTETETVTSSERSTSGTGEKLDGAFKRLEVSETSKQGTGDDLSDPIAPFTITLSSSDSKVTGGSSKTPSAGAPPPGEERNSVSRETREQEHADSNNNDDSCQGAIASSERSEAQATQAETFTASANDTAESCNAQVPLDGDDRSDNVACNQQQSQASPSKTVDSSRAKAVCGSIVRDLFDPLRKQIPASAEYTQLYTCGMLDTPMLSSRYQQKVAHDGASAHETTSLTSLASASTETFHSEPLESMDASQAASDERSTILKCITDNSFLEFLITEGLELDARSKQGVVDVVLTQYSNKLNRVESTIPKLAAQIRDTETTIGQQKDKVKHLQDELEFVKGEIVKNENLLHGFINEQQGLSKQRKALKRKVARCEGTMKHLLGNAKKPRLE